MRGYTMGAEDRRTGARLLDPDRLLPTAPELRRIARPLYERMADQPLVCPHGHTDARWFATDEAFPNAAELLLAPDHYLLRMLASQGVPYPDIGLGPKDGDGRIASPREAWRCFASHYHLFRGTPSRIWLDHALHEVLGVPQRLSADTADASFDHIDERLASPEFRPRALYERFNIEVIATTDAATDSLEHHTALRDSGWAGRVLPTFRPDAVADPEHADFAANVAALGAMTGADVAEWPGYLDALRQRRAAFKALGATATDHGFPSPLTADLAPETCRDLHTRALAGSLSAAEAELYRAQVLTEMAGMSVADGLVMQLHPGSYRSYAPEMLRRFGRDIGFDIPTPTSYVRALKPLLDRYGLDARLTLILFTLDETTLSRELAPLAGAFPSVLVGPAWWFYDAPEGMRRHRKLVTETAGFYNTAGFNDDTRAFLSIPARHDVFRRIEAGFLAELVAEGQIGLDEAEELAQELAVGLARRAYRLKTAS